ncbi:hypothetical protein J437_LFUL009592 [Ladona fulva]|uniref:Uncharacterized protein n=1 Tax=Ladona fulva TaxID=123851 RepID=A0A8K0KAZ6_LADFU|nr:hypothetical protein J437_LFUL009592 [Ladona fulva]
MNLGPNFEVLKTDYEINGRGYLGDLRLDSKRFKNHAYFKWESFPLSHLKRFFNTHWEALRWSQKLMQRAKKLSRPSWVPRDLSQIATKPSCLLFGKFPVPHIFIMKNDLISLSNLSPDVLFQLCIGEEAYYRF